MVFVFLLQPTRTICKIRCMIFGTWHSMAKTEIWRIDKTDAYNRNLNVLQYSPLAFPLHLCAIMCICPIVQCWSVLHPSVALGEDCSFVKFECGGSQIPWQFSVALVTLCHKWCACYCWKYCWYCWKHGFMLFPRTASCEGLRYLPQTQSHKISMSPYRHRFCIVSAGTCRVHGQHSRGVWRLPGHCAWRWHLLMWLWIDSF